MKVRATGSSQTRKSPDARRAATGLGRISSSAMLSEAAERMEKLGVDRLFVIEDNTVAGWIASEDVAGAVLAGTDLSTTPVKHAMRAAERKESNMKARVTDDCISCGRCVEICPEVFEMGDEKAFAKVDPIPEEYQDAAQEAADECPTSAITIDKG